VTATTDDGGVLVSVHGDVDMASATALQSALAEATGADPPKVVVDLSSVTFFGSEGVRCVLQANTAAERAGVPFLVRQPSAVVDAVMAITGVSEVLQVVR